MTDGSMVGLIAAVALGVLKTEIANYISSWVVYLRTGEYNCDGEKDTDDWCEMLNGAKGEWFLARIAKYSPPWLPGGGGVRFYTKDGQGREHENNHPLLVWGKNKQNRRCLSEEQSAEIAPPRVRLKAKDLPSIKRREPRMRA